MTTGTRRMFQGQHREEAAGDTERKERVALEAQELHNTSEAEMNPHCVGQAVGGIENSLESGEGHNSATKRGIISMLERGMDTEKMGFKLIKEEDSQGLGGLKEDFLETGFWTAANHKENGAGN
ncbi:hypothetical protein ACJX0J_019425 [Zea mays]